MGRAAEESRGHKLSQDLKVQRASEHLMLQCLEVKVLDSENYLLASLAGDSTFFSAPVHLILSTSLLMG